MLQQQATPEPSSLCRRAWVDATAHALLDAGDCVVLGLSGGGDSVALLSLLTEFHRTGLCPLTIVPAHMNHALRGTDSDADQAFCLELTRSLGLPLVHETLPVRQLRNRGESMEEAGRRLHYDFLQRVAEQTGAGKVAVAHHADDVAETLVMRWLRGCGLHGLAAMPPMRPIRNGSAVRLIRPLLALPKSALLKHLALQALPYRTDATNTDPRYLRNNIRINVLPLIRGASGESLTESMTRIHALSCGLRACVSGLVESGLADVMESVDPAGIGLRVGPFAAWPSYVRRACFRRVFQRLSGDDARAPEPNRRQWEVLDAMPERPVGYALCLSGQWMVRREHGIIYIFDRLKKQAIPHQRLHVPGHIQAAEGIRIHAAIVESGVRSHDRWSVQVDPGQITFPLQVRARKPGDRFFPLGAPGESKLKDFFINRKVPFHQRDRTVLVLDANERIIWVAGYEIAEFCRLTGGENTVLELCRQGPGHLSSVDAESE